MNRLARPLVLAAALALIAVPASAQDFSTAQRGENTMPATIDAVREYATLGEICSALRDVYGIYEEPAI